VAWWSWIQQHRWLSVLALAIVVLGTAGGTTWALVFRTVSSPINLREALRLYRRSETGTAATTSARNRLPLSGVYSYASTGSEGLSMLGVQRDFPARTTMIVTGGRCASVTWDPIEQHTEATVVCPAAHGAYVIPDTVSHESIGGSTTTSTMDCKGTLYLVPPDVATGEHWSSHCTMSDPHEPVAVSGVALGPATVRVGGHEVQTERVTLTVALKGTATGTNPTEYWVVPSDGLIVRERERVDVVQDGVRYSQTSDSVLISLNPAR
jgi:hypothetical protein